MAKKTEKGAQRALESIMDLSAQNVWGADGFVIARLWDNERGTEDFLSMEEKLLNTLRLAFEVVHYNPEDPREAALYEEEGSEWAQLQSMVQPGRKIAIKAKRINRLADLTMQNVKFISAATLLELIDRNFGGGWDAVPANLKNIIESAFDISTSQLPTSRIHAPGGSRERKLKAGYEVLEIQKGTWTEAVFARKKEELDLSSMQGADADYDDADVILDDDDAESNFTPTPKLGDNFDDEGGDDTYYSQYAEEAEGEDELEDGMHIAGEDDF